MIFKFCDIVSITPYPDLDESWDMIKIRLKTSKIEGHGLDHGELTKQITPVR